MKLVSRINRARVAYSQFMMPAMMNGCEYLGNLAEQKANETGGALSQFLEGFSVGIKMSIPLAKEKNEVSIQLLRKYEDKLACDLLCCRDLIKTWKDFTKAADLSMHPEVAQIQWIKAAVAYPENQD